MTQLLDRLLRLIIKREMYSTDILKNKKTFIKENQIGK
jgi:hypothetical protein